MLKVKNLMRWSAFGTMVIALLWLPFISIYASEKRDTNTVPDLYGSVDIEHVLVDGTGKIINSLAEPTRFLDGVNVGTSYTTAPKTFDGYIVYKTPNNASGTVLEGTTTVTYQYVEPSLVEGLEGTVIARYVDESGVEIAERHTLTGYIGSPYSTTQKELKGYRVSDVDGGMKGTYEQGVTLVTYEYELKKSKKYEVQEGMVITKYVDAKTGHDIAKYNQISGALGDTYTVAQKQVHGYEFINTIEINGKKEKASSFESEYGEDITTIVYHYEPIDEEVIAPPYGSVVVKHVEYAGTNEDGEAVYTPIAPNDVSVGVIGKLYETLPKGIKGYGFAEVIGDVRGLYEEEPIEVLYVYNVYDEPIVQGVVTAEYVDEFGEELASSVIMSGPVGEPYETTERNLKGHELQDVLGEETGSYTKEPITIVYIYGVSDSVQNNKPNNDTMIEEENKQPEISNDGDDVLIDDSMEDVVPRDENPTRPDEDKPEPDSDDAESPLIERPIKDDDVSEQDDSIKIVTPDVLEVDKGSEDVITNDSRENTKTDSEVNKNNNEKVVPDNMTDEQSGQKEMIPQAGAHTNKLAIGMGALFLSVAACIVIFGRKEKYI